MNLLFFGGEKLPGFMVIMCPSHKYLASILFDAEFPNVDFPTHFNKFLKCSIFDHPEKAFFFTPTGIDRPMNTHTKARAA